MHTHGLRALSIAALALVLLTACDHGSSAAAPDPAFTDLPVIRMMSHAMADMKSLETVHVKGDLTLGEAVSVDLDISAEGDCSGRMTIRAGELQVLGADGTFWFKGDRAFWLTAAGANADDAMQMVGDRWVLEGRADRQTRDLCDLDTFVGSLTDSNFEYPDAKGDVTIVAGKQAIDLFAEGDYFQETHFWVAVDDKHHILKAEHTGGGRPADLEFSQFNQQLDLTAPTADEIADLGQ